MSNYWNLRQLLDIDPQTDTCVGLAKTSTGVPRCSNPLSVASRREAGSLLDRMDSEEAISSAALKKLAGLMLCKGQHNCDYKPSLNQVYEVYRWWRTDIRSYVKKEEKKAERQKLIREAAQIEGRAQDSEASMAAAINVQTHFSNQKTTKTDDGLDQQVGPAIVPLVSKAKPINSFANCNRSNSGPKPRVIAADNPFEEESHARPAKEKLDAKPACQEQTTGTAETPYLPSPPVTPLNSIMQSNSIDDSASPSADTVPEMPAAKAQGAAAVPKVPIREFSTTIVGTTLSSKFDAKEQMTLLEAFNLNFETTTTTNLKVSVAQRSSDTRPKTEPTKHTNFAAEFGAKENFPNISVFELLSKEQPSAAVSGHLSIVAETQEEPVSSNEHQIVDEVPTCDIPTTSQPPILLASEENPSSEAPPTINPSSASKPPSPPPSPVTSDVPPPPVIGTSRSSETPQCLQENRQPSTVSHNVSNSEVPNAPDTSNPEKPSALVSKSTAEPFKPLPPLNQEPLPTYDFGFVSKLPNFKPRTKVSPAKQPRYHKAATDYLSRFEFGSKYEVPPKSFDFDTWTKVSLTARLPANMALIWDGSSTKGKDENGKQGMDREVDQVEVDLSPENTERHQDKPSLDTSIKTDPNLPKDEFVTESEEIDTVSETPETLPIKIHARQDEVPLTPEATPEKEVIRISSKPPKSDENGIAIIEKDTISPEVTPEMARSDGEISSTIEQHSTLKRSSKSAKARILTRGGPFGYALVTPERRYRTRLSEKQRQQALTPPESPAASHSFGNGEVFPDVTIEPFTSPLPGARSSGVHRKPVPGSQRPESSGSREEVSAEPEGIEEEARDSGEREQIEWENSRSGMRSRRSLGRKLGKQVVRRVQEGWEKVSEVVQRKSGDVFDG